MEQTEKKWTSTAAPYALPIANALSTSNNGQFITIGTDSTIESSSSPVSVVVTSTSQAAIANQLDAMASDNKSTTIICPQNLELLHGSIEYKNFDNNTISAKFNCTDDYLLSGSEIATCYHSVDWDFPNGPPRCVGTICI